jgi:hypothetical protein
VGSDAMTYIPIFHKDGFRLLKDNRWGVCPHNMVIWWAWFYFLKITKVHYWTVRTWITLKEMIMANFTCTQSYSYDELLYDDLLHNKPLFKKWGGLHLIFLREEKKNKTHRCYPFHSDI